MNPLFCLSCSTPSSTLFRCSGPSKACSETVYCGEACAKKHYDEVHHLECGVCNMSLKEKGFYHSENGRIESDAPRMTVLHDTDRSELVAVHLKAGEEIPAETHDTFDQFIVVQSGRGIAKLSRNNVHTSRALETGTLLLIPAGTEHTIKAVEGLWFHTLYTKANVHK